MLFEAVRRRNIAPRIPQSTDNGAESSANLLQRLVEAFARSSAARHIGYECAVEPSRRDVVLFDDDNVGFHAAKLLKIQHDRTRYWVSGRKNG